MAIDFQVDPDKSFDAEMKRKIAAVSDLRIPLNLIRESWFKSNNAFFKVAGGPGRFADLSADYKIAKEKEVGFIYPILRKYGTLQLALTEPGNPESVSQVYGNTTLVLGVSPDVPYFRALQTGRKAKPKKGKKKLDENGIEITNKGMPARPYILLGTEQTAPTELNTRVDLWRKTILDYVIKVANRQGQQ